jgi:aspartate kinase
MEQVSYYDAIELAYYGASVIHPKTIKPLQNKKIPLYVKSFIAPEESGTLISEKSQTEPLIPSFIFKSNQVLISISAKDFSFIVEDNLSDIFKVFAELGVKVNLMQNSAISFSVCIDNTENLSFLIDHLQKDYKILFNDNLELFTIRHYDQKTLDFISDGKEILLEQKSRHTAQLVMKK